MPRYLEKRRRRWYAYLNIPKDLRPSLGKRRFIRSLETESLSVAERRIHSVIAEWKKEIAIARGNEIGTDDELLEAIKNVRRDSQRLHSERVPKHEIQMAHEEVAMTAALGNLNDYSEDQTLLDAVSVVHDGKVLLREHIQEYQSTRDVAPKTLDMQEKDLLKFSKEFIFAEDATREKVIKWVNVTLGETEGLSLATRSRMISAARGYWDYLERFKGLKLGPPFNKVLPPKAKRKTKVQMAAQRKAFRNEDYQKLVAASEHPTLTDLIVLAAYTGCRIEELCILKTENVAHDRFEIVNAKSEAGWRTIPIHREIKQTVARLLNTTEDGYLLSGLTFNKYGNRSNALGKRFGRLKDMLGYGENYVFHSFRKGFATQLENANIPLNVSARLMGHEISGETFGRYSDGLAFRGLKEAIEHIDWRSS